MIRSGLPNSTDLDIIDVFFSAMASEVKMIMRTMRTAILLVLLPPIFFGDFAPILFDIQGGQKIHDDPSPPAVF